MKNDNVFLNLNRELPNLTRRLRRMFPSRPGNHQHEMLMAPEGIEILETALLDAFTLLEMMERNDERYTGTMLFAAIRAFLGGRNVQPAYLPNSFAALVARCFIDFDEFLAKGVATNDGCYAKLSIQFSSQTSAILKAFLEELRRVVTEVQHIRSFTT